MVTQRNRSSELYALFEQACAHTDVAKCGRLASSSTRSSGEVQTFNKFAQTFATNIASVSDDIMRLTKLIGRQTAFDDQSPEATALTQKVKANLQRLHGDIDVLEELKTRAVESQRRNILQSNRTSSQSVLGPNTYRGSGDASAKATQQHSDAVVDTLKFQLANMGQSFRVTLQKQSSNLKSNAERRHMFTAADRPQTFESALFMDKEQQQQQQQQLFAGTGTDRYYQQRMEAVRQIESSVAQVGELFSDFSRLVQEQSDIVVRIDNDVDDAVRHVNAGSNELMRYLTSVSSNRGLIVKLFAILFFFLLFFGFVVVR